MGFKRSALGANSSLLFSSCVSLFNLLTVLQFLCLWNQGSKICLQTAWRFDEIKCDNMCDVLGVYKHSQMIVSMDATDLYTSCGTHLYLTREHKHPDNSSLYLQCSSWQWCWMSVFLDKWLKSRLKSMMVSCKLYSVSLSYPGTNEL